MSTNYGSNRNTKLFKQLYARKRNSNLPDDYRLHLDLYAEDQAAEVKRLMRLGAKMIQPAEKVKKWPTPSEMKDIWH